jgi:peptide/nickel transport system permease protein
MTTSAATSRGLYSDAVKRIWKDKFATACFFLVILYAGIALSAKFGLIATRYNEEDGPSYAPPSWTRVLELPEGVTDSESVVGGIGIRLTTPSFWAQAAKRFFEKESWTFPFGTDFLGRDVYQRILHGSRIAMSVGLISSLIAIPIGVFFGAIAGYYGGKIDEFIVWLYSTVSSVPDLLLILTACMVMGKGLLAVYISIGMTTWVQLARLIRAEFMKHKQRDYVVAAKALGAGDARCIFVHILPNVFHIVIINLSLRFVAAIKVEVILSYLGVGAQGDPSWGVMINDAKQELMRGVWWQLAGATLAMFFIVLALSIFADALRDALDPKLKT